MTRAACSKRGLFVAVVVGLLIPALLGDARASGDVRVGVLATPDSEELAALLTNALIERGVVVVERTSLSAVANERAMGNMGLSDADALRLGEIAGADALLMLGSLPASQGDGVALKLIDVRRGLVLAASRGPTARDDPAPWSDSFAERTRTTLARISEPRSGEIILALPRLKSTGRTGRTRQIEDAVNFLLVQTLSAQSGFVVAERQDTSAVMIERQAAHGAPRPLSGAHHLLEGRIEELGGDDTKITLGIAAPAGGRLFTAKTNSTTPVWVAVDQIVAQLCSALGAPLPKPADPETELTALRSRIKWLFSINRHLDALELLHTAEEIRPGDAELTTLRATVEFPSPQARGEDQVVVPELAAHLDFLRRLATSPNRPASISELRLREALLANMTTAALYLQGARDNFTLTPDNELFLRPVLSRCLDLPSLADRVDAIRLKIARDAPELLAAVKALVASGTIHISLGSPEFDSRLRDGLVVSEIRAMATAPGSSARARFAARALLVATAENKEERITCYEALFPCLWELRDEIAAEAPRKHPALLEVAQLSHHPDLAGCYKPQRQLLEYILLNSTKPISYADESDWLRDVPTAADAVVIRKAALASSKRFEGADPRLAIAHQRTLAGLAAALERRFPEIASLPTGTSAQGIPAAEPHQSGVQTAPVENTFFWNILRHRREAGGYPAGDQIRGLFYHNATLWVRTYRCVYEVSLPDGGTIRHERPPENTYHEQNIIQAFADDQYLFVVLEPSRLPVLNPVLLRKHRRTGEWIRRELTEDFAVVGDAKGMVSAVVSADGRFYWPRHVASGSNAVSSVTRIDPQTMELDYIIRADRRPSESPMDIPGNGFQIARVRGNRWIDILALRQSGNTKAMAHEYDASTGAWRQLTSAEYHAAKLLPIGPYPVDEKAATAARLSDDESSLRYSAAGPECPMPNLLVRTRHGENRIPLRTFRHPEVPGIELISAGDISGAGLCLDIWFLWS